MIAHATHRKMLWMVFVAIVILVLVPMLLAAPPTAPPSGTWRGQTEEGIPVKFVLTEDGGCYLEGMSRTPVSAVWTWEPLAGGRGILRCEPADWPNHPATVYHVMWLDGNRIELWNEHLKVTLQRMT
jgi:hypothetical protein